MDTLQRHSEAGERVSVSIEQEGEGRGVRATSTSSISKIFLSITRQLAASVMASRSLALSSADFLAEVGGKIFSPARKSVPTSKERASLIWKPLRQLQNFSFFINTLKRNASMDW